MGGLILVSFKAIIEKDIDILAFPVGPNLKAVFCNEIRTKLLKIQPNLFSDDNDSA